MTGEYEKVLPMDILPVYLLKAILANNIERMEQLGIYEVIEEDLALCEFVCTSKINVQEILRQGINAVMQEYG
jgi:Na+-transporting NADH:ubiquinone oxidoreductase subunit A